MLDQTIAEKIKNEFLHNYEEHADAIFRFVYFRTRNRELALDVTQETYLRTWKYLAAGNEIQELRSFLYRTAKNLMIDTGKQAATRNTHSLDAFLDAGGDIEDNTTSSEYDPLDIDRALKLLADLKPPEYREAIELRFIEEFSPKEIAEILGVSENVVSVRINRGIKKLNKLFIS